MMIANIEQPDCPIIQWPTEAEPWAVWQINDDGVWPLARFATDSVARCEAMELAHSENRRRAECNEKRRRAGMSPISRCWFSTYVAAKSEPKRHHH